MQWVIRGLGITIAALLTTSALPTLAGRWPFPNLVLTLLVVSAIRLNFRLALYTAALGGLILDVLTPGRGFYTLFFVGLAGTLHLILGRMASRPTAPLAIALMASASAILATAESLISGTVWSVTILNVAFVNLITMAIFALILYLGRKA